MERVVYILGAGFSAPLGIPVVRDFLTRAKDLYFEDRSAYSHFAEVFEAIKQLANVKNYLDSDLFDLEEVFSIIEMQRQLDGSGPDFDKFIADVVKASTPKLPHVTDSHNLLMNQHDEWGYYAQFALELAGWKVTKSAHPFVCERVERNVCYDVLSLNYDRALELPLDFIRRGSQSIGHSLFKRPGSPEDLATLSILKLHGDAYDGSVVPPTWDKSLRADAIKAQWQEAFRLLSVANYVRVIGYSFPMTDTYFRYFLKAALSKTEHLKALDVLTSDPDGLVKERCSQIFAFKFMRFLNSDIHSYMGRARASGIEDAHRAFFGFKK